MIEISGKQDYNLFMLKNNATVFFHMPEFFL
jgi:hypothetical protein